MRAFAIGCMIPNTKYVAMTRACIESIRAVGHKEDIVVVTIDPSLEQRLADKRCQVRCFKPIHYPAVDLHLKINPKGIFRFCDAQKIHFWRLTDYDKVVSLDADITMDVPFQQWDKSELSVRCGWFAPINTGIMLLSPNQTTVKDLLNLTKNEFSPTRGWGNFEEFEFNGRQWRWDFQGAFTAQGYIFYYFRYLKESLRRNDFVEFFHWSGEDKKQQPEHRNLLARQVKL